MIKQFVKVDQNYNIIELGETDLNGNLLYHEKRTYHDNNSLKSFHLKDEFIEFDPDFNVVRSSCSNYISPEAYNLINPKESELTLKALDNHIFSNHTS